MELSRAREDLHLGRRVGLVLRRARRHRGLSQSALATQVGWSSSSINRAEQDASPISLIRVDRLLRQVGHRLAIVADTTEEEVPDEDWGTADLLARDRRGRRFPPFARLTWEDPLHRDLYRRHAQPLPEWTWTRG